MLCSLSRSLHLKSLARNSVLSLCHKRSLHFQWNFKWKDYKKESALKQQANADPNDAHKQSALLKQMNTHNPAGVIKRVESGVYANDERTIREYIAALYKENKLDQLQLSPLVQLPNSQSQSMPAAAIGLRVGAGFNAPMRVQFVRHKWENYFVVCTVLGVIFFLFFTGDSGTNNLFNNVAPTHQNIKDVRVTFSDVMGADEAKLELQEVVEYLRHPDKFETVGAKLPKGVLMSGPPGTGKTLLAKAMAGEAGVNFLYIAGSAFDEMYVGVGPKRVRKLFQEAVEKSPCIVFIDEIDAVGGSRDNSSSNKDSTLQQLLTELDGFNATKGVVVIAATNCPESLDPALVRPGRFDKQVHVSLPDAKGRREIFQYYLQKVPVDMSVNSEVLARATPGFSGADISQLVNSSAIKSVMQGKQAISMDIIDEARDDIIMGRMKKSGLVDGRTRQMTAYHEGGHALVALLTEGSDPVHKVTITQRGSALGMVKQIPAGDQLSINRQQMEARLAVLMGGRAAEELVYGRMGITSAASNDLMQASKLANLMVKEAGFSDKVGLMYISQFQKTSPSTEQMVDEEVRSLLQKQYDYAKHILATNRDKLDTVAQALLDKETLSGNEVASVLGIQQERQAQTSLKAL